LVIFDLLPRLIRRIGGERRHCICETVRYFENQHRVTNRSKTTFGLSSRDSDHWLATPLPSKSGFYLVKADGMAESISPEWLEQGEEVEDIILAMMSGVSFLINSDSARY
jgi:hypothetical protein